MRILVARTVRNTELSVLDDLIKARFVEMFGDILSDNKLPLVQIKELADIGSSKRIYADESKENGIPFYRSKEIIELGHTVITIVRLKIAVIAAKKSRNIWRKIR